MTKNKANWIKSSWLGIVVAALMTLVLVVIATQISFAEPSWKITNDGEEYDLADGKATLTVETDYPISNHISYQWYDGEGNEIWGATSKSYIATESGFYRCEVSTAGKERWAGYSVGLRYSWKITNKGAEYVLTGGKAILNVAHNYTGSEPISYQWYRSIGYQDGIEYFFEIVGATNKSYIANDMRDYHCKVSIAGESVWTEYYVVGYSWKVTNDGEEYPLIDGKATLTVAHNYTGSENISYQWYDKDYEKIVGATSKSYTASNRGNYYCEVRIPGEELWAEYSVGYSWKITNKGAELVLTEGKATLSVETDYKGSEPISYQWYEWYDEEEDYGDDEIEGETGKSYIATDDGDYFCKVSIAGETLWAKYSVGYSWKITDSEKDDYVLKYGKVILTAAHNYTGSEPVRYQWYDDDENKIVGATSQSYTAIKGGEYSCRVSIGGEIQWGYYYVFPEGYSDGDSWEITNSGDKHVLADGKATLSVETDYEGSEPTSYQWYVLVRDFEYNEIEWKKITGATNQTYVATKLGSYECEVSIAGETRTATYYVSSMYPWKITNKYAVYTLKDGKVTLSVETDYTGSEPISYQWYSGEGEVIGYKIAGATSQSYTATKPGYYECLVSVAGETRSTPLFVVHENDYCMVRIGDLRYELNTEEEAYQAGVWGYTGTPSGSISIQDRVTLSNGKTYTVTKLRGLYGMMNVTQMSIPATVTDIEERTIGYYGTNDTGSNSYNKISEFTIIGKSGSAAHQYALDNGFNFKELDNQGEQGFGDSNDNTPTTTPVVNNPVTQPSNITTVTVNAKTVNAASIRKAITEAGGSPEHVKKFVLGKKVKKISKKAFAGFSNITTLEVRTKKLKAKSVKDALKGSSIKTVKVNVGKKKDNKKFIRNYKKIFTKKNAGKKVKIKGNQII